MKRYFYLFICLMAASCFLFACTDEDETPGENQNPDPDSDPEEEIITVSPDKIFKHPGALHTEESFERIRKELNAGNTTITAGYEKLKSSSLLTRTPQPTVKLIRGGGSAEEPETDNYSRAMNDVAAAYQMALIWKIEGDEEYAKKAVDILNAWAQTCTRISGDSNTALASGIYGYQFANAAELLRDYEGWERNDFENFKTWIYNVFYKDVAFPFLETHWGTCDSHYWANWDLCNLASLMSIGILCDDVEMYTYAIDYLMSGVGNGRLMNGIHTIHKKSSNDDIELGQMQEAGRDQGHTLMCIGLLGTIAEIAWNQGEDVYGYQDNLILKGAEYVAKYNFAMLDVPFKEYTRLYGANCNSAETHTEISDNGRGDLRPIWQRIYSHYTGRKGIAARYVKMARNMHYPEGGGSHYGGNSGGFDELGFGTLLYSLE